jgi:hypothetical protein
MDLTLRSEIKFLNKTFAKLAIANRVLQLGCISTALSKSNKFIDLPAHF